ncbi:hypothetical protein [Bradyrhizobium genosp. P]|uniref:hypothetical protein n=1 Tax=Bradyrhizobium genosp. P TaxID=83641 RepID=UPI003CF7F309
MVTPKPKPLVLGLDLLLFKLHSLGALVSCTQLSIVEYLTAGPVYMLDVSRDYPHLPGNRGRRYNKTSHNEDCSQHCEISQAGAT